MLVVNPKNRITISELMKHPWINQDIQQIPETPLYINASFDFTEAGQILNNTLNDGLQNERRHADSRESNTSMISSNKSPDSSFKLGSLPKKGRKRNSGNTSSASSASNVTGGLKQNPNLKHLN